MDFDTVVLADVADVAAVDTVDTVLDAVAVAAAAEYLNQIPTKPSADSQMVAGQIHHDGHDQDRYCHCYCYCYRCCRYSWYCEFHNILLKYHWNYHGNYHWNYYLCCLLQSF